MTDAVEASAGSHRSTGMAISLIILGILSLGLLFWGSMRFTRITNTGTDFISRWLPVRVMLTEGEKNPSSWFSGEMTELPGLCRH